MSCATQTSQAIRLTVTVGNFPEGYCPSNFQQFAADFAARLIVSPNQNNSTFVTGSVEPTSNVGPWLKDCEEWFVFDDSTGRYRPTPIGVFNNMRYYTANDTFIVPDNIYKIKVHAWGAGGGGCDTATGVTGSGGGAGGYGVKIFDVVPNQNIPIAIGSGGSGGAAGGTGGNTTVLTLTSNGGTGGTIVAAIGEGGVGGTVSGADFPVSGGSGNGAGNGGAGGTVVSTAVGIGGSSSNGGDGGKCSFVAAKANGVVPGGGGAGQTISSAPGPTGVSGAGANGAVLIEY